MNAANNVIGVVESDDAGYAPNSMTPNIIERSPASPGKMLSLALCGTLVNVVFLCPGIDT